MRGRPKKANAFKESRRVRVTAGQARKIKAELDRVNRGVTKKISESELLRQLIVEALENRKHSQKSNLVLCPSCGLLIDGSDPKQKRLLERLEKPLGILEKNRRENKSGLKNKD